jgi:nucleoside-diphosphate-sugar epimerase
VLAASEQYPGKISTAIVCPPCIYGPGRGPDNQRSMQAYRMASAALKRGKGFQVLEGKNIWTEVHVQDLSNVYLALVAAALEGGGKATWNDEGYYFAENGDIVWGDIAKGIAKAAHDKGLIKTADVDGVSTEEADQLTSAGSYLWGMNSRCRAYRANKLFGWKPEKPSLQKLLPSIVEDEAKLLGLIKGHAEQAAG